MLPDRRRCLSAVVFISTCLLTGCTQLALAPGADKVRITSNSQDVATCTAVGNIKAREGLDPINAERELRNLIIGLGGNTGFLTSTVLNEGVAYRCP